MGFWDPLRLSEGTSEGRLRFYREAELKHGRIAMLATVGFVVAEFFHPFFGGRIYVPSISAWHEILSRYPVPASQIAFFVCVLIAIPEFQALFAMTSPDEPWSIRNGYRAGGFGGYNGGFDPLGLGRRVVDTREMENRELNNGRLAMLAFAGMVAQELVTGQKLFHGW
jgi:hypothetical protein